MVISILFYWVNVLNLDPQVIVHLPKKTCDFETTTLRGSRYHFFQDGLEDCRFALLPFLQTEQLNEDNIARCMCIGNLLCLFSCVEKDLRAVQ